MWAKRPENLEPVTELPADAPDWLRKKWSKGGHYHRFRPDDELKDKARHVDDWLKVAVQDAEPWLKQLNHGRPTRFTSINPLDDALDMADADMRDKNKKLATQLAPTAERQEAVMDLGSGFRMVLLATPTALDRKNVAMGHCIGQGGYDAYLQDSSRQFFSLRDGKNLPHLQRFLSERRYKLDAPPGHTWLIELDGCFDIRYNFTFRSEPLAFQNTVSRISVTWLCIDQCNASKFMFTVM